MPRRTALLLVAAGMACDDATTPLSLDAVAGTWHATRSEFTVIDDPSQSREVIAEGGSFTMTIGADGTYTWEIVFDAAASVIEGTVDVVGDALVFDPDLDDAPPITRPSFAAELRDDELRLTTDITVETGDFGFETGEFDVPVHWEMNMRRSN